MSPSRITESTVEDAALDWTVAHGPDLSACDARACIAPDTLAVERPGEQRSSRSMKILHSLPLWRISPPYCFAPRQPVGCRGDSRWIKYQIDQV